MNDRSLAVLAGTDHVDYTRLRQDIDACANWLARTLTANEVRIAVGLRHDYWHWVTTLALLQLGKACASIYQPLQLPPALQASFDVWLLDGPSTLPGRVLALPMQILRREMPMAADATAATYSPATVGLVLRLNDHAQRWILTSGTTGQPKVVVINAAEIRDRLAAAGQQYGIDISSQTRLVSLMGIDTIGAFLITLTTWFRGGAVLMGVPAASEQGNTQLPLAKCNLLSASPARLKELLDKTHGVWPGRDERQVRVGGARLHPMVRDGALARIGYRVQTTYGATELGLVASCDASRLDDDPGAAGQVLANVQVQVVDQNDQPVPSGQPGLVRCKTLGMATGYAGEAASAQFRHGWFYPGDIGTLSAGGWLSITGRDSDVLNLGGLKLSAVELETRLLHIEGLQDVCLVLLDKDGAPTLAVAAVHGDDLPLQDLRERIEKALTPALPFHLVRVPGLPRNAMGKLPRAAIANKLMSLVYRAELSQSATDRP